MANFYFTDRKYNLIDIVTTEGTRIKMTTTQDVQDINNAVRLFEASIEFPAIYFELAERLTAVGNFVLYRDYQGKSVWITIESQEYDPVEGNVLISGRDAGIDLINEVVPPFAPDKQYSIKEYIEQFTYDSGFTVNINEISDNKRRLPEWENENTALERILSVANQFDAELDFSFELDGLDVIKKHINIYQKRGTDVNPVTLYVGKEIGKIRVIKNIYDLANSIYPLGSIPDGKDKPINLKGYKYTDPDGRYLLDSNGYVKDTESVKEWSRLLSNENTNPQSNYIVRTKSYDTLDQKKLFDMALADLKRAVKITENYEVDIWDFPTKINIGDTVNLADETRRIYLSARVLTIEYDYVFETAQATLGDYVVQQVDINGRLLSMADALSGQKAHLSGLNRRLSDVENPVYHPNEVYNSSFERFNEYLMPDFWETEGRVTTVESLSGTHSLKLTTGQSAITKDRPILAFKWSDFSTNFTVRALGTGIIRLRILADSEVEKVFCYVNNEYVEQEYFDFSVNNTNWFDSKFGVELHPSDKAVRLSIECLDGTIYIDDVSAVPMKQESRMDIQYVDGPMNYNDIMAVRTTDLPDAPIGAMWFKIDY